MKASKSARECRAQFIKGNRLNFAMSVVMALLSAAVKISIAFALESVIRAMESGERGILDETRLYIMIMIIFSFALSIMRKRYKNAYLKKGIINYKTYIFGRLFDKSIDEFERDGSAKYISAFSNDLHSIESNYLNGKLSIISEVILFALGSFALFYFSPALALSVLISALLPAAVALTFSKKLRSEERQVSDRGEAFVDQVKDLLGGFVVIKSFKAEKDALRLFLNQNTELESAKRKRRETGDTVGALLNLSSTVVIIVILSVGMTMVLRGNLTIAKVLASVQLQNYIVGPLIGITNLFARKKAAFALIEKISRAVEGKSEGERQEKKRIEGFRDRIRLKNVSFSYNGAENAIKDISLDFEKGKSYAVVGGTGSGKTTLLELVLARHLNYVGEITIDGEDIKNISLDSLYNQISEINQEVFLFNGSIYDNITMHAAFDDEKFNRALKLSGLEKLIKEKGRDYPCGSGGANLSGGEKQRISIARCLIRETPVILMDEATAALDAKTAYDLTKSVLELEGVTKIVVTHKIDRAIMEGFDEIIVLSDGDVKERGSFDALMEKKEYFYSLYTILKT